MLAHEFAPALVARGITKVYPGVVALEDVSLATRKGGIHALVGKNGAGKSTLVKVLTGAVNPDRGEIEIDSHPVTALNPRKSQELGVFVIHQERQVAPDLTVAENVLLGSLPTTRLGRIDWSETRRLARERLEKVGLRLDPRDLAGGLSVAEQQVLEIARALSTKARLIIMDEPTSALGKAESKRLIEVLRVLRDTGVSILYISHHLEEVFELADDVTVLRDGRVVATESVADLDMDSLTRLMLGQNPEELRPPNRPTATGEKKTVIEVREARRSPGLADVSFEVRTGEILCISGAIGCGRRELSRVLAGIEPLEEGTVSFEGQLLRGLRDAVRKGICFIPDDRKREGLLKELSVLDNLAVGQILKSRSPIVRRRVLRREALRMVEKLDITIRDLDTQVTNLSGGNQQKVIVGRWLAVGAKVLIFFEPTAGVDVGASVEIYRLLRQLAADGAAIVIFSSDYNDIKQMSDRVLVLRRGEIAGELSADEITEERLLQLELAPAAVGGAG